MNILKKDQPLSVLILADALIAAGEELYVAFALNPPPLTEKQFDAILNYSNVVNALRRALKQPEPSNVHTSPKPPTVPGA